MSVLRAHILLLSAALSFACSGDGEVSSERFEEEQEEVFEVEVETDVLIDVASGDGVGVFLEYSSGGYWELFTTCDSDLSGIPCDFDIFVSVALGSELFDIDGLELEREDELFTLDRGVMNLLWQTASDFDRVQFRTTAGETIRLDVLIDGVPDPEVVFWNGYGALQFAAPSNPVDFTPDQP